MKSYTWPLEKPLKIIYTVLSYLAVPVLLIRLIWKSRRQKGYLQRMNERFGFFTPPNASKTLWIHAVSVGEVIATAPLIKQIREQYPDLWIVMTTMTLTGAQQAKTLFDKDITHLYAPYDIPFVMARFLKKINPLATIIMETEIWPHLLDACHKRQIPVFLANARLSAKSAAGYKKFAHFARAVLQQFTLIAAQTQADAQRFIALGVAPDKIHITGSIKFDQNVPASTVEKAALFKSLWCQNHSTWIAASTHEGEEKMILESFQQAKQIIPNLLLILVPRHPERFPKIIQLTQKFGFNTLLRSTNKKATLDTDVVIGDSMGELLAYYAAADVAFVGGSLIPVGGHNLLEPAAVGVAAITGPHLFNFKQIANMLHEAQALEIINNSHELTTIVVDFLQDNNKRYLAGERGRAVVEQNRGAVQTHLQILDSLLNC